MLNRRSFLQIATTAAAGLQVHPLEAFQAGRPVVGSSLQQGQNIIFVAPNGNDNNDGTSARPLLSFAGAQRVARQKSASSSAPIVIYFRQGTYYLDQTVIFTPEDSGKPGAAILYSAYPGESVVLSGGRRLQLTWTPYRDGIMQAKVPQGLKTDQMFVNGMRQILARYPNYDPKIQYLNGFAKDAISPERARRWADPAGGYIHALHPYLWGSLHYRILGKDAAGNLVYEGGWQNNRDKPMHEQYRYVEGIFEELDAPGEWFLNEKTSTLYFYPPVGMDLQNAVVEVPQLESVIRLQGTMANPVSLIGFSGFTFKHTLRTFMKTRERLVRSDWRIYRGGGIFVEGATDCSFDDCRLDQLGGNAIFFSDYNRNHVVSRCHISAAAGSGVCFVGDPQAVRNPLFDVDAKLSYPNIDKTPGPLTENYPKDCRVEDCLIHGTGTVEKQTAGIEISMSESISILHCSIYDLPRSGINIGDGTWGGHCIDGCDVFDSVKETGDHGSFNSWGRDRWWGLQQVDLDTAIAGEARYLPILDTIKPIVLRNSRWRCDHGWDIDLDDGSSRYHITNNLCLNGGIKLREGFYRTCENNVMVNNTLHPHVWYNDSEDTFRNNIVFVSYRPIHMRKWTSDIDFNFLHTPGAQSVTSASALQALSGDDMHSVNGDADFINPALGDYRVKQGSPALKVGFVNFATAQYGVRSPALRALALEPSLPGPTSEVPSTLREGRNRTAAVWQGATVRNVVGAGEVSALGTAGENGVLVLKIAPGSPAERSGLLQGDVVTSINKKPIHNVQELISNTSSLTPETNFTVTILRLQRESELRMSK